MQLESGKWLLMSSITVFLLIVGIGCNGDSTTSAASSGPTPNDGLVDLKNMLTEIASTNQPIPKNVAELAPYDPVHPVAASLLQNGSLIYYWGSTLTTGGGSKLVIAHEAEVESKGGWVLLQDGTIQQMTSEEFKAASKPDTKK